MKKLISGVLVLVMALSLVGCGKPDNSSSSNSISSNDVSADTSLETYTWPDSEIGKLIDPPASKYGELIWSKDDSFYIEVDNVKKSEFNDYVKKCKKKGFDTDYTESEGVYLASNLSGYKLSLIYLDDSDQMTITMKKEPEKEQPDTSSSSSSSSSVTSSSSIVPASGIRPEVKEAIDSYETFMDEYAAFMKKYNNSNDTMSMLTEYADYMSKYADALSKFNALNTDLNNDEAAYYSEVSMRVAQKLLDAAG